MIDQNNPNVLSSAGDPNIPYNYRGIYPGRNDGRNDGIDLSQDDGFFADYMSRRTDGAVQISFDEPQTYSGPATNYSSLIGGTDAVFVYSATGTSYQAQDSDSWPQYHKIGQDKAHVVVLTGIYEQLKNGQMNSWLLVSSWGNEYYVIAPSSTTTITVMHWDE